MVERNKKSVFLTIIRPSYDGEGRQIIKGEFYCQNYSVANLKEIITSISSIVPPEASSPQTSQAHEEFQRLWWESKHEKRLK